MKEKFFNSNLLFNPLVTRKKYLLLLLIEIIYFSISYYIVSPSNFNSFSDTLRYYISALGTLLAVVVSFNTVALQNQLKNLPTNIKLLDSQLNRVETMIKPILLLQKEDREINKYKKLQNNNKNSLFDNVTRYYSDALKNMMIIVNGSAKSIVNKRKESELVKHFQDICKDVSDECEKRLEDFKKSGAPFHLIKIDTTRFVVRLTLTLDESDDDSKNFYNLIKNLHILRNISSKIYLRNLLSNLTHELLFATIPIIAFIGVISSISN
ncbi:MAG TPA: hypothetical protein VFK40_06975, partial [Nitrososphaeraceae archaeon]|nr:hypothetical protein [Nitrososphaeraceae archaeon]